MANPDHLEILQQGVEAWNDWRVKDALQTTPDLRDADLVEEDFSGIFLNNADLRHVRFDMANLSQANIGASDLSKASLWDANLHRASLSNSKLVEANLGDADLTEANLTGADLRNADLSLVKASKAILYGADLSGANLEDADLSMADLRATRGTRLDSTFIRDARFSPNAPDPWSTLRRNYTGPRLLFHLLVLVAFFLPYAARTMTWVGVNRAQESIISTTAQLKRVADRLVEEGHPSSVIQGESVAQLSRLQPCLTRECTKLPIWKVLVGLDRGPGYWVLAVALLLYNFCRGLLTWRVAPLRDEEERSGHTPPLKGKPFQTFEWRNGFGWLRSWLNSYGWLIWPHRIVQGLLFVAALSFLFHAWDWLTRPVWLPS
jgi:hypothetical protein